MSAKKSVFAQTEDHYLGHVIGADGIKPELNKISGVMTYPTPRNVKVIYWFVFILSSVVENFSEIVKPLTDLTRKDKKFEWTERQEHAFQTMKKSLTTPPV